MANESSLETMNHRELRQALANPQLWLGWSAQGVKDFVVKAGGWRWIFTGDLPKWAHFIRQMLNEEPSSLTRVSDGTAKRAIQNAFGFRALTTTVQNHVYAKGAPSGDVYWEFTTDARGVTQTRSWIEQSQAGTKYHYKKGQEMGDGTWGDVKHTWHAATTTHAATAAFKLCLPDGTGGSNEACFRNKQTNSVEFMGRKYKYGRRNLKEVGSGNTVVRQLAITDNRYRGSYNYADTMATGYDLHVKFDVDPDKKWGQAYVDEKQFSPLSGRIFEPRHFVGENL